jgi:hypothetical protein
MKCIVSAAVLLSALCLSVPLGMPAAAQQPPLTVIQPPILQNAQIDIAYVPPTNPNFRAIYDRMRNRQVLEELRQFVTPLRLPRRLSVKIEQCGAASRPYTTASGVTLCYEFIDQIERLVPNNNNRETTLVGTFVQAILHEVALAVFDQLQVPVWGRIEDAADSLAGFMMVQFGEDVAYKTVIGTAIFFELTNKTWTGSDFASVNAPEAQRYYNFLCMAYGGAPRTFAFLVQENKEILPKRRADRCRFEYEQIREAFSQRVMPFVDPDLMTRVRATPWSMDGAGK